MNWLAKEIRRTRNIKKFKSSAPPTKKQWGSATWKFLHTLAAGYEPSMKNHWRKFIIKVF